MTYDTQKAKLGRTPVYIVTLHLDRCTLSYGIGLCTAAIGATGETECFNTLSTCQDVPNFDQDTSPIRFSSARVDELQAADEPPTFPNVTRVTMAPTKLDPGKGLGERSSVTVEMVDFPWTDRGGLDPYIDTRNPAPVDWDNQGTLLGRLIARHQYYEGRQMDIETGYLTDDGKYDAANFIKRSYVLYRVTGPDAAGTVVWEGKDLLKATDTDRAQWPVASEGQLDSAISDTDTSITIDGDITPYDDAWTDGQPWLRINDEVMEMTGAPVGQVISVTRAVLPSIYPTNVMVAAAHSAGDTVQICYYFDDLRVDDIVEFLCETASGIDSSFIPIAEWNALADDWLSNHFFSALITEPIGVRNLLTEITEHLVLLWWNEREQEIKFDAIKPVPNNDVPTFNDTDHLLDNTVAVTKDVKNRLSQVWVYFGQRNPVEKQDEFDNYRQIYAQVDLDAESDEQYGSRRIRKIFSRWLPTDKRAVAIEVAGRLLARYRDTRAVMQMQLDPKDDDTWTGDTVDVETQYLQDELGNARTTRYLILKVEEMLGLGGARYKYTLEDTGQGTTRTGLITPDEDPNNPGNPFPDYTDAAATATLKNKYAWISQNNGFMSNGDPGYVIS